MPNVNTVATPATVSVAGAEAKTIPIRFTAGRARLIVAGASASVGPSSTTSLAFNSRALNVANSHLPIGFVRDGMVYITQQEQVRQQEHVRALREIIDALVTQVSDNSVLLALLNDAQSLAATANDNASAIDAASGLKDSFPDPAGVLTASNSGVITIAAHNRVYSDIARTVVAVNAGSVTGLNPGETYTVFYNDVARQGGAVTYEASQTNVPQVNNIHVVGTISIPAAGETDTTGTTVPAPGVIDTNRYNDYYPYYQY